MWLLQRWERNFGWDRAAAIARANNDPSPLDFRATGNSFEIDSLANVQMCSFASGCWTGSDARELARLADIGKIYLQDEASQLVGNAVLSAAGHRVLDVCAAPGSKTTQISVRLPADSFIAAGDVHFRRIEFLRENCERQSARSVNLVQYDAESALPFALESFDTVLVDAPCTGTGTIRQNPEIRYFAGPDDPLDLSSKQLLILRNASKMVSRGGTLFYSTCSLEPEENEDVCRAFMAAEPGFVAARPDVPARFLQGTGFARTFPDRDGLDGFFIAAFHRIDQ